MIKYIAYLFVVLLPVSNLYAQCETQLFHTEGTVDVGGVEVTVTSTGGVSTDLNCEDGQPYRPGFQESGAYTFQFSPAIDSLKFNCTALNNNQLFSEILKIEVNGAHYSVPAVADSNSCSMYLPVITAAGNLISPVGPGAGSNGIVVPGPIDNITFIDSFTVGNPGGIGLSIFLCSDAIVSIDEQQQNDLQIFPVPASESIKIQGLPREVERVNLFDHLGSRLPVEAVLSGDEASLDVANIPDGVYYLVVQTKEQTLTRKVLVAHR